MTFADVSDAASAVEEQERETAIAAARVAPTVPRTGVCLWCSAPVLPAALYCDRFCREDYQKALWAAQQ